MKNVISSWFLVFVLRAASINSALPSLLGRMGAVLLLFIVSVVPVVGQSDSVYLQALEASCYGAGGFWEGGTDALAGTYMTIFHPIETGSSIGESYSIYLADPGGTLLALENSFRQTASTDQGKGRIAFEVAFLINGTLAPGAEAEAFIALQKLPVVKQLDGLRRLQALGRLTNVTSKLKPIIQTNRDQGLAFQDLVASNAAQTQTGVVQELTLRTQGGFVTRIDIAGYDAKTGLVRLTEAKSSANAPLTNAQKIGFYEISQTGATVRGKGKPGFPSGSKLPPTNVEVVRPSDLIPTHHKR